MSNAIASVGSAGLGGGTPSWSRRSFTKIVFNEQRFYVYKQGTRNSFNPSTSSRGDEFLVFSSLVDCVGEIKPDFVSESTWNSDDGGLKNSSSGFVTGVLSLMPKMISPSDYVCNNGWNISGGEYQSLFAKEFNPSGGTPFDGFNWKAVSINGQNPPTDSQLRKLNVIGDSFEKLATDGNKSETATNISVFELEESASPPTSEHWVPGPLVGSGAFQLVLAIDPIRPSLANTADKWKVDISFGEVTASIADGGGCVISSRSNKESIKVTLADSRGKDCPPHLKSVKSEKLYILTIYPTWNGIIIQSGIQDSTKNFATVSSSYLRKNQDAAMMSSPYSSGFNPLSPADIEVSSPGNTIMDIVGKISVQATNCQVSLAYSPCFFSHKFFADYFSLAQQPVGAVAYDAFGILAKNNISTSFINTGAAITGNLGQEFVKVTWGFDNGAEMFTRHAPEVLGAIFMAEESDTYAPNNESGSTFSLLATGGSPLSASGGGWDQYIQQISTSSSFDGSSGSITVDKDGKFGRSATPTQTIGQIGVSMSSTSGIIGGYIFKGMALGVDDSKNSSAGTLSVNLVGAEIKLRDISLVNAPFFDGETASNVLGYLAAYAGLSLDLSGYSNPSIQLTSSVDFQSPVFDIKTGTPVADALNTVCENILAIWYVENGILVVKEIHEDGFPTKGIEVSASYPDSKIISYDAKPDFSNLRNEVIVFSLKSNEAGNDRNIGAVPFIPRIETAQQTTNPEFPWAKQMFRGVPGIVDNASAGDIMDRLLARSIAYDLTGGVTIPGNASIKLCDTFRGLLIVGINHSVDLSQKQWTTTLSLAGSGV